jgi:hypothetical protein
MFSFKYKIPSDLSDAYEKDKMDGPKIKAEHIYNPCMPIKWRDDFLPVEK